MIGWNDLVVLTAVSCGASIPASEDKPLTRRGMEAVAHEDKYLTRRGRGRGSKAVAHEDKNLTRRGREGGVRLLLMEFPHLSAQHHYCTLEPTQD